MLVKVNTTGVQMIDKLTRIPTSPTDIQSNPSIHHPSNNQGKKSKKTSRLHVGAHLRHSIWQHKHVGKKNLPSYNKRHQRHAGGRSFLGSRTLSHEVLQMVPLDIVRQVTDIHASFLLRGVANRCHHLLFGHDTFLEGLARHSGFVIRSRMTCLASCSTTHGRAGPAITSAVVFPTAGATAGRI